MRIPPEYRAFTWSMSWRAAALAALSTISFPEALQVNPPAGDTGDWPAPPYSIAAGGYATEPVVALARKPPAKKAPTASAEELAEKAEEEKVAGEARRQELEQKEAQAVDAIERMVSQADLRGKLPTAAQASTVEPKGVDDHDDTPVSPLFRLKGDSRTDYWCDDTAGEPMFEGIVSDSLACEEKCGTNSKCGFFSFFEGSKYCLLSEECSEMSPSSKGHVKVFAKTEGGDAAGSRHDEAGGGEAVEHGPPSGGPPRSHQSRPEEDRLLHDVASRYLDRSDDFYDAGATFKAGYQPRGPIVDIDAGIMKRIAGFVVDQLQGDSGLKGGRREVGMLQSVAGRLTAALAKQPPDTEVTQLGAKKLVREAVAQTVLSASRPGREAAVLPATEADVAAPSLVGRPWQSPEDAMQAQEELEQAERGAEEARRAQRELRALEEEEEEAARRQLVVRESSEPEREAANELEARRAARDLRRLELAGGSEEDEDGLERRASDGGGAGAPAGGAVGEEAEAGPAASRARQKANQTFRKVKSIGQALGAAELVPRLSEAAWGKLGAVWAEVSEGIVVARREPEVAAAILELVDALTEGQKGQELPHGRRGEPQRTGAGRAPWLDTAARDPKGLAPLRPL